MSSSVLFRAIAVFFIVILLINCVQKIEDKDDAQSWLNSEELYDRYDMLEWKSVSFQ